jgi:hypothetical protein
MSIIPLNPPTMPPLRPIDEAPIRRGKSFGLCLLFATGVGWVIGLWDGYAWFTRDRATEIDPLFFQGPLPLI